MTKEWRCFHCDDVFTSEHAARLHFGSDMDATPACKLKGAEGGLLEAIRDAERSAREAWDAIHSESLDVHKALRSAQSRLAQAVRAAEELGFARGIDVDLGIDLNREQAQLFGNYIGTHPAVPEMGQGGRARLRWWASQLAEMAAALKQEAAELAECGQTNESLMTIRLQLSVEETGEWAEAVADGDIAHAFKELVDMSVVTDGHYVTLGLAPLKLDGYREVMSSNRSKLVDGKPLISAAGRHLKGPDFRPADMGRVLAENSS